jgi:acetyl-CoA decarbonylase/synthase complex subunit gamma
MRGSYLPCLCNEPGFRQGRVGQLPLRLRRSRAQLSEASAPPIRPVVVGAGVRKATTGGETVQYRHEKTFYNPTLLAAQVGSDIAAGDLETKLKGWNALQFERVGLNLRPELVAVKDVGGNADAFAAVAKQVAETSEFNLILMTEDAEVMKAGVEACAFKRPLMYAATEATADAFGAMAKENDLPLAIKADSIDGLTALSDKLTGMGLKDLVMDPGSREPKQSHQDMIAVRRAALKDGNRAVGFPTIAFPCEMASIWTWKPCWPPCTWPNTAASSCCPTLPARVCSRCCWNASTSSLTRSGP